MGNRSRHKSRHVHKPTLFAVPLAHLMRTHCPECAAPVEWLNPEQVGDRSIDLGPALQFLGETEPAEVWACTRCDNYGVMGPTNTF